MKHAQFVFIKLRDMSFYLDTSLEEGNAFHHCLFFFVRIFYMKSVLSLYNFWAATTTVEPTRTEPTTSESPTVGCVRSFLNPPEPSRTYSSIHSGESPGVGHGRSTIDSAQGWSSATNRQGEWMQIDLGSVQNVTGVTTQCRANYPQCVTR